MKRFWWRTLEFTYITARRVVITVVGTSVLLIGMALLVLPGPAFVVIPIGLAILSIEFAWARRWLRTVKEKGEGAFSRVMGNGAYRGRQPSGEPGDGSSPPSGAPSDESPSREPGPRAGA